MFDECIFDNYKYINIFFLEKSYILPKVFEIPNFIASYQNQNHYDILKNLQVHVPIVPTREFSEKHKNP